MQTPPYIPLLQNGWIRIEGDHNQIPSLSDILVPIPFGYRGVLFHEEGPYLTNMSLIENLFRLNSMGVVFGEDFKQMYSPAAFMRELQTRAILKTDFISIQWRRKDQWELLTNKA